MTRRSGSRSRSSSRSCTYCSSSDRSTGTGCSGTGSATSTGTACTQATEPPPSPSPGSQRGADTRPSGTGPAPETGRDRGTRPREAGRRRQLGEVGRAAGVWDGGVLSQDARGCEGALLGIEDTTQGQEDHHPVSPETSDRAARGRGRALLLPARREPAALDFPEKSATKPEPKTHGEAASEPGKAKGRGASSLLAQRRLRPGRRRGAPRRPPG